MAKGGSDYKYILAVSIKGNTTDVQSTTKDVEIIEVTIILVDTAEKHVVSIF
jgi:hypothetical protein